VNFSFKDGTAITSIPFLELKSNKTGHGVLETEHLWIHPVRHTVTGSNSKPDKSKKIKATIHCIVADINALSNQSHQLDQLQNKRGNLGKTPQYGNFFSGAMLGAKTSLTYGGKKLRWANDSQHGGKIMEKANARSNSPDTQGTLKIVETRLRTLTSWVLLNSRSLNETSYKLFVYKAWIQDLPKEGRFISSKTFTYYRILLGAVFEKQRELMELARNKGKYDKTVLDKQLLFARSKPFRELAVIQISRKSSSQTLGVDQEIHDKIGENMHKSLVEYLREIIYHPNKYRVTTIKRASVSRPEKIEKRLMKIPTIKDRTLQALINLVLLPLVELNSDPNSYGFRPHRDCKMAVAAVRIQLKTVVESKPNVSLKANHKQWILNADIKGFFGVINHEWLTSNVYLHLELKKILHQWLKAKILDKGAVYADPLIGTPQSGIISPTLVNFTLNGLETLITEPIFPLVKFREQKVKIKYIDGKSTRMATSIHVIRYAGDLIVITKSKNILSKYIVPVINSFCKEKGLWLSPTKTKQYCFSLNGSQLNFLGYTFKYRTRWSFKKTIIYSKQKGKAAIALYPNRRIVIAQIRKLRLIFKGYQNSSAMELISKLNPVIRRWSNYFNLDNCSRYRSLIREALYRLTWMWMRKKHPTLGKRNLAKLYFLTYQKNKEKTANVKSLLMDSANKDFKFKNNRWIFHCKSLTKSNYNKDKIEVFVYLLNPTNCTPITAAMRYLLPEKLRNVNAFDKEIKEVTDKHLKFHQKLLLLRRSS
jgi:group II intron reverse transcriptase/maturase